MIPAILESGGAKSRSSLQRSLYSTSSSPSSSSRMLEAETMEEERREVRELPLELLNSDMGEMHEERPGQSIWLENSREKKANLTWRRSRCRCGCGCGADLTLIPALSSIRSERWAGSDRLGNDERSLDYCLIIMLVVIMKRMLMITMITFKAASPPVGD